MIIEKVNKFRILWVENDFYHIQSLLYWVKKDPNCELVPVTSLYSATEMLQAKPLDYFDLIILDFIMSNADERGNIPFWFTTNERLGANGVLLLKHMRNDLKLTCPILILSIMENPIKHYDLKKYDPIYYLEKRSLKPTIVENTVKQIICETKQGFTDASNYS